MIPNILLPISCVITIILCYGSLCLSSKSKIYQLVYEKWSSKSAWKRKFVLGNEILDLNHNHNHHHHHRTPMVAWVDSHPVSWALSCFHTYGSQSLSSLPLSPGFIYPKVLKYMRLFKTREVLLNTLNTSCCVVHVLGIIALYPNTDKEKSTPYI